MVHDLWTIERGLAADGYTAICGVDEAGRGPLAGPVYAAAVILPIGEEFIGLDDSKKLSERTRDRLFDEITAKAVAYGIASAGHDEIDSLNILNATYLAMNRAIDMLCLPPDIAIIDGNRNKGICVNSVCVVGGDGKSASIAAASILAKVSRDRFMLELAKVFPQYGFERHKGYGTRLHYNMLREFGPSEVHRRSFLKGL
ncbi:MAG: ribonuclease HII [Oscillospiraceae bacterium]|nr:ribonuclease HII [Oscillospiraceae bacterium]